MKRSKGGIRWLAVGLLAVLLATLFWLRRFRDFLRPGKAVTFFTVPSTHLTTPTQAAEEIVAAAVRVS